VIAENFNPLIFGRTFYVGFKFGHATKRAARAEWGHASHNARREL